MAVAGTETSRVRTIQRSTVERAHFSTRPFGARQALVWYIAFLVMQFGTGLLFAAAWAWLGGYLANRPAFEQFAARAEGPSAIVGTLFAASVVMVFVVRAARSDSVTAEDIGLTWGSSTGLVMGLAAGIGLGCLVIVALPGLPVDSDFQPGPVARMSQSTGWEGALFVVSALFLFPIFEEFLYRGALFGGLRRSWGALASGIVTTVLFVGMHYPEFRADPPAIIAITGLALLTLGLRTSLETLAPAVAAHATYNATVLVGMMLWSGSVP